MLSFFNFARQITNIREAISGIAQRTKFDLEVCTCRNYELRYLFDGVSAISRKD